MRARADGIGREHGTHGGRRSLVVVKVRGARTAVAWFTSVKYRLTPSSRKNPEQGGWWLLRLRKVDARVCARPRASFLRALVPPTGDSGAIRCRGWETKKIQRRGKKDEDRTRCVTFSSAHGVKCPRGCACGTNGYRRVIFSELQKLCTQLYIANRDATQARNLGNFIG